MKELNLKTKRITLGQLEVEQDFFFGEVLFTVEHKSEESDELVACKIKDQNATVYISDCAWVTITSIY